MTDMTLSEELQWRGFIKQTTLSKITDLDSKKFKFYHGYDASDDSLTIGNLAAVMMDRVFIRHGHQGVILAGGATSLIGDPGGKDSERQLQTTEQVEANVKAIKNQLEKLVEKSTFVNNLDWFKGMGVLEFLRDVGKNFSMTPLVQRDYIAKRMGSSGSGISYTEFSYTILQGYDFLKLHDDYGVDLELAGSDQWGNSLSGVELIKKTRSKTVHVLTCPIIINKATGKKFGKTEGGAIWLNAEKTSPLEFYQFWVNVEDEFVEDYLKVFTELDKSQIDQAIKELDQDRTSRAAQFVLADEVTAMVHGQAILKKIKQASMLISGKLSLDAVDSEVIEEIKKQLPNFEVNAPFELIEAIVKLGLASSNTEARRLVLTNSIYLNGKPTNSDKVSLGDFQKDVLLVRRGKAYKDTGLIVLKK